MDLTRAGVSQVMRQVLRFHLTFGAPFAATPALVPPALSRLRFDLIHEETMELREAIIENDLIEIADALADIVYVAYGTALVYGIDLDAVIDEVHRSNMTKLGADGRPHFREDGKVLKGPDYEEPDIETVLQDQTPMFNLPEAGDE